MKARRAVIAAGAAAIAVGIVLGTTVPANAAVLEYSGYTANGYYYRYSDHQYWEGYDYASSQVRIQHYDVLSNGSIAYEGNVASPGQWSIDQQDPVGQVGDGMVLYAP